MAGNSARSRALLLGLSLSAVFASAGVMPARAQTVYLDPITIVATRTEELAIATLAPVSTIRGEQIQQIQAQRVQDLFFGVPSVTFQQRGDDPATAINIRGLQDFGRVAVVVDGARQNHQRTGHNADGLFYLDPALIGGVDVVRGPSANIYGSGAIGGVVSFRTKDVEDILDPGQKWGTLNTLEVGSNLWRIGGSSFFAAAPTQNFSFLAGVTYKHNDNYRDGSGFVWRNTQNDVASVIAKININPSDGHTLKFNFLQSDFDFFNGLQPPLSTAVFDSNVKNTIAGVRWKYSRPEDRLFDFDVNTYYTQTDARFLKICCGNSQATGNIGNVRSFLIDTYGFDANNTSRFDTGAFRHAFTVGVDGFQDQVATADPQGTGDLFTPSGRRTVLGSFAQMKSNYSSWLEIITALRYDNYQLDGVTSSSGDRVSPKITIGITPVQGIQPYYTYAEGYRAPAITEVFVVGQHPNFGPGSAFVFLPNGALRPETGKTHEVGVNFKYDSVFQPGDAFRAKANVFRNNVEDFIELTQVLVGQPGQDGTVCVNPTPGNNCQQYQNITQARIEGFEFEAKYDAGLWFIGLAGQHIRGKNSLTGVPLLKIQPDQIATTVGFRMLERRLTFAVRWAAVDGKDRNEIPPATGTPTYPVVGSYHLVNLHLGYQVNPLTLVSLGVDNLLNEQYARYGDVYPNASGQGVTAFPSPGIIFKGSVQIKFGDTNSPLQNGQLAAR